MRTERLKGGREGPGREGESGAVNKLRRRVRGRPRVRPRGGRGGPRTLRSPRTAARPRTSARGGSVGRKKETKPLGTEWGEIGEELTQGSEESVLAFMRLKGTYGIAFLLLR